MSALGGWKAFAFFYLAPLAVFSWWIWTVTYLQHHEVRNAEDQTKQKHKEPSEPNETKPFRARN